MIDYNNRQKQLITKNKNYFNTNERLSKMNGSQLYKFKEQY